MAERIAAATPSSPPPASVNARQEAEHVLVATELADFAERVEMHEPPVLHGEAHVQIDRIRRAVRARLLRAHAARCPRGRA